MVIVNKITVVSNLISSGVTQRFDPSGRSLPIEAAKADMPTTIITAKPTTKITMSFMGPPSQDQRPEAKDRGNPEAHECSFLSAPRKPEVDREEE